MNYNLDSLVRSAALVLVGLPLTLSITNLTNTTSRVAELALEKSPTDEVVNELRSELVKPCLDYYLSKVDSKLEREAKNTIDDVMGGEVNHKGICDYIVN
jgi:hypothetical protein